METHYALNLFDLAPRELTNSAVWAWILDGINQKDKNDPRAIIAHRFFEALNLAPPDPPVHIVTEKALPSGCRLDVALSWADKDKEHLLFIENKVLPAAGLAGQVLGYLNELTGGEKCVCPVIFSHDSFAPKQVAGSGVDPEALPTVFVIKDMIRLLNEAELFPGTVLFEFREHLKRKQVKTEQVEQALRRGGADVDYWLPEIRRRGMEDLFLEYLAGAERSGCSRVDYNFGRSVAIRYAARSGLKGSPVFSLHPKKCSKEQGLWIGYNHENWNKIFCKPFPASNLPGHFENQPDTSQPFWHFGFFPDAEAVGRLFSF